jgi:hypothetical protein
MGSRSALVTLLALTLCVPATAQQVYKCLDERGNPVYSQRPCADDPEDAVVVDTSRALKTSASPADSNGQLTASQFGRNVVCERREYAIEQRKQRELEALERQIADYGRNDAILLRDLQSRQAALQSSYRKELKEAKALCLSESRLPPEHSMASNRSATTSEQGSWRCTAESGLVFYRHDACPISILEPARDDIGDASQPGMIIELTVHGKQIPRTEACRQMEGPESRGRRGSRLDQEFENGQNGC